MDLHRTLPINGFNTAYKRHGEGTMIIGNIIAGLQVDIPANVVKARLMSAVTKANVKIEDLIAKIEANTIAASDVDDSDELEERHHAKQLISTAKRKVRNLQNVVMQAQFLADYVVEGAVYRLDAEDARRLSTADVDADY